MPKTDPDLDSAYALETPEDNRKLYANWAQSYDADFASDMDYRLPEAVAQLFRQVCVPPAHVLDVGAGTGLVAEGLKGCGYDVDALDISTDMLELAKSKQLYRTLIEADLTQPLDITDASYDAIISAGTFTHGHVGPDALDPLLRIAKPGAVFVLSVNAEHFDARGFAAKFDALEGEIRDLAFHTVQIYGPGADKSHAQDEAKLAVFYKR